MYTRKCNIYKTLQTLSLAGMEMKMIVPPGFEKLNVEGLQKDRHGERISVPKCHKVKRIDE